jgi:hypothetical protein
MGSTVIGFDVAQHHGGGIVTASYPDLIPLLLLAAVVPVLFLRGRRRSTLPHRIAVAIGAGI